MPSFNQVVGAGYFTDYGNATSLSQRYGELVTTVASRAPVVGGLIRAAQIPPVARFLADQMGVPRQEFLAQMGDFADVNRAITYIANFLSSFVD